MTNTLADRLEQAEKPCRELDEEIAEAVGWYLESFNCQNINGSTEVGELWFSPDASDEAKNECKQEYRALVRDNHWPPESEPPAYTSSLDAAMTLVPEGWTDICMLNSNGYYEATLNNHEIKRTAWGHNDHSFALALSAASMRARGK